MPALDLTKRVALEATHMLSKRKNWAARNPGVMVVFCVVFVVAVGLLLLFIRSQMAKRRGTK